MAEPHRLRLSRTPIGVNLNSNGRNLYFTYAEWEELGRMMSDFSRTNAPSMQNYADLPTRTPIHSNTPTKANLDDLI